MSAVPVSLRLCSRRRSPKLAQSPGPSALTPQCTVPPQVGSHCSDLQELIGGQPWILVRIPAKADTTADESKLSGPDKVSF